MREGERGGGGREGGREREREGGKKGREGVRVIHMNELLSKTIVSCVHLFITFYVYAQHYFSDTVTPIDFEYGGPNFLIFDIANHFCEFGGMVQGHHT